MHVSVIGAGYVGLVAGVCLAEIGHQVQLIDTDRTKVSTLQSGKVPIHEPHLQALLTRHLENGRLHIYARLPATIKDASAIFLALPTPPQADGRSDLQYVLSAVRALAPLLGGYTVIVTKSTVPVGTTKKVYDTLSSLTQAAVDVVSNPEFLREGMAVQDFLKPQRIIVGTSSAQARACMEQLYASFTAMGCPLLFMDEVSAELSKYASNAFLATKISFINEIAQLCSKLGADVCQVQQALSLDKRVGKSYLRAGIGYGGSCLPKDLIALQKTAEDVDTKLHLLSAVRTINAHQRLCLFDKAMAHFDGQLSGHVFAIWGLAFKPDTDDLREAPAMENIAKLREHGAKLRVYDPVAMENARKILSPDAIHFCDTPADTLTHVDALFVMTEWPIFSSVNLSVMKQRMQAPVVFDGRNMFVASTMRKAGFIYYAIGLGDR